VVAVARESVSFASIDQMPKKILLSPAPLRSREKVLVVDDRPSAFYRKQYFYCKIVLQE
jgi:hypothetical protein